MTAPLIIWQFTDEKPGHENQSTGLIQAIKNRTPATSHKIVVPSSLFRFLFSLLFGRLYLQLALLPKPTHLIAAGRRTQLPMILAHLWFGGKRIVLMRSYWPNPWFDYMIIPKHDSPKKKTNILSTRGVVNNIKPSNHHNKNTGLILIGGPSQHYQWDSKDIVLQISTLLKAMPETSWTIANSRRTPQEFFQLVTHLLNEQHLIDHADVDSNWLPAQLAEAGQVWVSPDSVSMVYEAITAGAMVGCFELKKAQSNNRIVNGISELIQSKMITPFQQWQQSRQLTCPAHQLNEAQRAADWILNQ